MQSAGTLDLPAMLPCCWLLSHLCQVTGREQHKVTSLILRAAKVIILMTARNILSSLDPLFSLIFLLLKKQTIKTLCNLAQRLFQVCPPWGLPATLLVNLSGNGLWCGQADPQKTCGWPSSLFTDTREISPGLFV